MAANLLQKGNPTSFTVFDIVPNVAKTFVSEQQPLIKNTKLTIASTIEDVGKSCNVIITMVPTSVYVFNYTVKTTRNT